MSGPVKDDPTKGSRPEKSLYTASDRPHGSGKEPQQQWYKAGSEQGGVAQGSGTSRSSHHSVIQSKVATSPSKFAASSVPSEPLPGQQSQPPADNLLDLLRYVYTCMYKFSSQLM